MLHCGVPGVLRYSRRGAGDGALVMLHGQLGVRDVVEPLVADVVDRTVLVPDLRGRGESRCRDVTLHRWANHVGDVVAMLDDNDVERAVVGGVSMGAGVAIALALAHPERVEALVCWASPYSGSALGWAPSQVAAMQPVFDLATAVLADGGEVDAGSLPPKWLRHDPMSIAAAIVGMGWSQPFEDVAALGSIDVPVLVVPGGDDLHPAEIADAYLAAFPHAVAGAAGRATVAEFAAGITAG